MGHLFNRRLCGALCGIAVPCVITAWLILPAPPLQAAIRYVSASGGHISPYDTWPKAGTNLKTVVDYANAQNQGDLVIVSNGSYTLSAQVNVTNTVVSNFSANAADTIVNGNHAVRCFYLNHSNAVVDGLTISNGYVNGAFATSSGGGVWMGPQGGALRRCTVRNCYVNIASGTVLTLAGGGGVFIENNGVVTGCVIQANKVETRGGGGGIGIQSNGLVVDSVICDNVTTTLYYGYGGGVALYTTGCSVVRSTITRNTGMGGGGIYIIYDGLVQDCVISNNSTSYYAGDPVYCCGGGVYLATTGTISRCTIVNNGATGHGGGGIYALKSATIERCIIANNYANSNWGGGGVLFCNGAQWSSGYADALVRNCLIAGNQGLYGGGVYVKTGSGQVIENCTIVSNLATRAGDGGGGVCYIASSTGVVINSIVYFNRDNGTKSNWYNAGILSFTNSCTAPTNGLPGTNNIADDPKFVGKDTGNYRLLKGSPCINAGTNRPWMDTAVDLFGHVRIVDGTVDMGAYEWYPQVTMLTFH